MWCWCMDCTYDFRSWRYTRRRSAADTQNVDHYRHLRRDAAISEKLRSWHSILFLFLFRSIFSLNRKGSVRQVYPTPFLSRAICSERASLSQTHITNLCGARANEPLSLPRESRLVVLIHDADHYIGNDLCNDREINDLRRRFRQFISRRNVWRKFVYRVHRFTIVSLHGDIAFNANYSRP